MRFACSAGVRGRRCAAFAISTVDHGGSTVLSQATLPRLEGMAGRKFGRTVSGREEGGTSGETGWLNFASMHGVHTGNAEEHSEGDLNPSRAYSEKIWICRPSSLPQGQRNFAGHPDKCPAEALPRNKALMECGMLGSSRRCYGVQAKKWYFSGRPPQWRATLAAPGD